MQIEDTQLCTNVGKEKYILALFGTFLCSSTVPKCFEIVAC
jgi:hypothetical protein